MGLFLNVLIVKNSTEENVRKTLERMEDSNLDWNLISAKCRYQECHNGVKVLLSDMCAGYEDMTQKLSKELMCPVLLCYIYDEDYWGYYFYEKGKTSKNHQRPAPPARPRDPNQKKKGCAAAPPAFCHLCGPAGPGAGCPGTGGRKGRLLQRVSLRPDFGVVYDPHLCGAPASH